MSIDQKETDRTFNILCLFSSAHFFNGAILPVNLGILLKHLPGTSAQLISIMVALTTVTLLISTIFFGFISEKLKSKNAKKNTLIISESIFFIPVIFQALSPNFMFYFICALIITFGTGAFTPLAVAMISELYPPEERGNKFGQLGFLNILGAGGGLLFGGLFIYFLGPFGWRFTKGLIAILGFLDVVLYFYFGIEPERGRVEPEFQDFDGVIEYDYKITFSKFKQLLKKKTIAGIFLYILVSMICVGPLSLWTIFYLSQKFGGENAILFATILVILTGTGALFGSIYGGKFGDKLYKKGHPRGRVLLSMVAIMLGVICLFIFYLIPFTPFNLTELIIIWILLLIIGFSAYVLTSFPTSNIAAIYAEVCVPEERSYINSISLIMSNIGTIIGHLIVAIMIQDSISNLSFVISFLLVIFLVSTLLWIIPYIFYSREAAECRELMRTRRIELDGRR
ncbi:MAG: MFS transporter [Promethearchaeota archaeon]|nr:MAG: MFS transporter [Candidatus Lokiarchaeota archaeon]